MPIWELFWGEGSNLGTTYIHSTDKKGTASKTVDFLMTARQTEVPAFEQLQKLFINKQRAGKQEMLMKTE